MVISSLSINLYHQACFEVGMYTGLKKKTNETLSRETKKGGKCKQCVKEFAVCAEQKPDVFASNYYYDNSFK